MARRKKMWVYSPTRKRKPTRKIPEALKDELERKAKQIIEHKFKPYRRQINEDAKQRGFNYVGSIYTKWWRNYFYFGCKYHCPGPGAISEELKSRFTRMEYVGDNRFNLAYMRYTKKWCQLYENLTLNQALRAIEEQHFFWPL